MRVVERLRRRLGIASRLRRVHRITCAALTPMPAAASSAVPMSGSEASGSDIERRAALRRASTASERIIPLAVAETMRYDWRGESRSLSFTKSLVQ